MTTPQRIQRKRTKGWRMPPNTVYVGRPTKWGNPWLLNDDDLEGYTLEERRLIVMLHFSRWMTGRPLIAERHLRERRAIILRDLHELRGKNLAGWCPLDKPCHADVLLKLANRD